MKSRKWLLLFLLVSTYLIHTKQSAVTCLDPDQWGGRLGDHIMMYVKAKWVAFQYNLPFFYKPFLYSDQFMMHVAEKHLTSQIKREYRVIGPYQNISGSLDQYISRESGSLYTIHYYFNLPQWGVYQESYDSQEIMAWPKVFNNTLFLEELKKTIKPRFNINIFSPPKEAISVAVHIRKGGGFDHPLLSHQLYDIQNLNIKEEIPPGTYADKYWPLKFPPTQYYVDQIVRVSEMYKDAPLYVHIYTDDENPLAIMQEIEKAVNKKNITFDCRKKDNHRENNLLEDMFSMAQYDCLIRGGSNFPQISQLIGNHCIVIYPKSLQWIGNTMIIDKVGIFIREEFNCENHVDALNEYGDC